MYTVFLITGVQEEFMPLQKGQALHSNCKYIYSLWAQVSFRNNNFHPQVHTGALGVLIPKPDIQIVFCQGWGLLLLHYSIWQVLKILYKCS